MKKPGGKLIVFLAVCFFIITLCTPRRVSADVWGANREAALFKQIMEEIWEIMRDIQLGIAKSTAIQSIHQNIEQMLSGHLGDTKFITDWEDFLIDEPADKTLVYMNDFFTGVYEGRSSGFYTVFNSEGVASTNYAKELEKVAQATTQAAAGPDRGKYAYTLDNYISDPSQMFSTPSISHWRAFSAGISNPMNNPLGTALLAESATLQHYEDEQFIAETKAKSYDGFLPEESGGQVTAPGSVLAHAKYSSDKAVMDLVSNAQSPWEAAAYSFVNMLIEKLFNQGIGEAFSNVMRERVVPVMNAAEQIQGMSPEDILRNAGQLPGINPRDIIRTNL